MLAHLVISQQGTFQDQWWGQCTLIKGWHLSFSRAHTSLWNLYEKQTTLVAVKHPFFIPLNVCTAFGNILGGLDLIGGLLILNNAIQMYWTFQGPHKELPCKTQLNLLLREFKSLKRYKWRIFVWQPQTKILLILFVERSIWSRACHVLKGSLIIESWNLNILLFVFIRSYWLVL